MRNKPGSQHQWSFLQAGFWRGSTAGEEVRSDRQARGEWTSGTGSRSKALLLHLLIIKIWSFTFSFYEWSQSGGEVLRSEALHQVLLHPPLPPLLRHPCAHHFLPQRLHHLCGILSTNNFRCYDTSSKLRTIYVRCETLITSLSPTTNGSPWQPVSSCTPSCSSNSSYRPSCPSSGQQLVSQCS